METKEAEKLASEILSKKAAHIKFEFVNLSKDAENALFECMIEFAKIQVIKELEIFNNNHNSNWFEKHEWDHLHDVVYAVTGKHMTIEDLKLFYISLPEDIQRSGREWGLNDTVVRDNIYEYLEKKIKK